MLRTTLALGVTAALAFPALATADSVVYADQGNIWSASPDGTKKVQLTDGGAWHSPTQADDGTIAAVQGTGPIHVLGRDGRPIRTITTQPARTGNGGTFAARPVNLSFSPDGTRIAYEYNALSCPPASSCTGQTSVFYTRADVTEATPQATWGNQFGASNPEWITGDRTVVQNAARVALDDVGGGDYSFTDWLAHSEDLGDPEISRDGTRLALTYSYGPRKFLSFYVMNGSAASGPAPAYPTAVCATGTSEDLADPSWSPDATGVVFEDTDGLNVFRFSSFTKERCGASGPTIISPTGRTPDWGPADPPAARWVAPITPPAPPQATADKPVGPTVVTAPGAAGPAKPAPAAAAAPLRVTHAKVTRAALRKGLRVTATAPGAGRVTATLSLGGRRLATGAVTAKRPGAVRLRLAGVRGAARLRGKALTLTVTAPGGARVVRKLVVR